MQNWASATWTGKSNKGISFAELLLQMLPMKRRIYISIDKISSHDIKSDNKAKYLHALYSLKICCNWRTEENPGSKNISDSAAWEASNEAVQFCMILWNVKWDIKYQRICPKISSRSRPTVIAIGNGWDIKNDSIHWAEQGRGIQEQE